MRRLHTWSGTGQTAMADRRIVFLIINGFVAQALLSLTASSAYIGSLTSTELEIPTHQPALFVIMTISDISSPSEIAMNLPPQATSLSVP
ncbi:hypothetical protein GJ744_006402 [Endocarpon pusillum]|uniref:Uncharacterized protein n=1 Tax=Endocarpon pusillum TaxID=364733 RepID=A0A8H7ANY5_9EURO|nr:hypothetical protein GJ744_006402 [Endocarpon pusillum]